MSVVQSAKLSSNIVQRQSFRDEALIMCPEDAHMTWFKSSDCLWSTDNIVSDVCMVNRIYPGLQTLFVDLLGITGPSPAMVYEEIRKIASFETLDVLNLKSAMLTLNSMLHESEIKFLPNATMDDQIFPVRHVDGTIRPMSASEDFGIANHGGLADRFHGKIKLLDFSVEEVFQLRPILQWAGLEMKYLTSMVRETTQVSSSATFPLSSPKRELKKKAHALLR
jgi:hypothetical protein